MNRSIEDLNKYIEQMNKDIEQMNKIIEKIKQKIEAQGKAFGGASDGTLAIKANLYIVLIRKDQAIGEYREILIGHLQNVTSELVECNEIVNAITPDGDRDLEALKKEWSSKSSSLTTVVEELRKQLDALDCQST